MSLSLCEEVRSLLNDVQTIQSDLESDRIKEDAKTLSNKIIQLQQKFQEIVASLSQTNLPPAVERQLRPCQTEGHRRLKLAGIAAMRLKTAKQDKTILNMRSQITEHLAQLQLFVEAMVKALCDPE